MSAASTSSSCWLGQQNPPGVPIALLYMICPPARPPSARRTRECATCGRFELLHLLIGGEVRTPLRAVARELRRDHTPPSALYSA